MTKIKTSRRFETHSKVGKPMTLRPDHNAIVEATTLFPNRVKVPDFSDMLFKSGKNNRKIGSHVTKGVWAGMSIWTLTLVERETCPTICEHWGDCFLNKMQWPTRWKAGKELERIIPGQIATLARKHPKGFVVRLHILGDFYSAEYVAMWRGALKEFPALHIFGYTAWPNDSEIGRAVERTRDAHWDRFAVRTSGAKQGPRANVYKAANDVPAGEIVCPAQLNKTTSCSTCGLCWHTKKPIAFLKH